MKPYTKKQTQLIDRINETSELIDEEKNWIEIASTFCNCNDFDEDFTYKMGLIIQIIINRNLKLYNYVDNLLCDLDKLI